MPAPTATDTAINVTLTIGKVANLIATYGGPAFDIATTVLAFVPAAAPVVTALKIALPIIQKIGAAAPAAAATIEAGRPVIEALQASSPELLVHLKQLYAIAVNHDPARPEENMTAADVSDEQALSFAGPVLFGKQWTPEEYKTAVTDHGLTNVNV